MTTTELVRTPDVNRELLNVLLAYKRELTDGEIAEMLDGMRPVVRNENGELCHIELVDPKNVSYIWDPRFTDKATGLSEIATVYTLHTWGYYGMFKPSLEEVVSMIPQHMIEVVKAFEIIGPKDGDDLDRQNDAVNAGYHVAVVILYGNDV